MPEHQWDGTMPRRNRRPDREKTKYVLSHDLGLTREETQFEIDKCNCLGQWKTAYHHPFLNKKKSIKKKTSKNFLKTFTYKQTHGVSHLCATPYSKLTRC